MAIPVNDKLVTVEALKAGLDTKPNATEVYTKSDTYTKAETNTAIQESSKITQLALTYTANEWVGQTQFNRMSAYKMANGIYTLYGNLASSKTGRISDFLEIGRILDWHTVGTSLICVPGQDVDSGVLLLRITDRGIINIYSSIGVKAEAFYRFQLTSF